MPDVRPVAIAVICHRPSSDRDAHRRAVAAVETFAEVEGYAVTQLFQGFGRSRIDGATVDLILDLADRVEAHALLTFGNIDSHTLQTIAVRSNLRVLPVPDRLLPRVSRLNTYRRHSRGTPIASDNPSIDESTAPTTSPTGISLPGHRRVRLSDSAVAPAWTGRLEIELFNERAWRVGIVEVVIRIDSVTLWSRNWTLAVMDRDRFRRWLTQPRERFEIDDVTWSVTDSTVYVAVGGSIPYAIPPETVQKLVDVI